MGDIPLLRRERSLAQSTLTVEAMTKTTQPISKLSIVSANTLFTTFLMFLVAGGAIVPSK